MADDINVYFIIAKNYTNENDCELDMQGTFELCKQYVKNCKWIHENDYEEIPKSKQNVIVYESFEGDIFKKLMTEKRVIVGYRCLKTCLVEKIPIPHRDTPVFIIPMVDLVICCSGIEPSEKKILQEKIGYMGGIYSPALTKQTTHLITNCVNSVKYECAADLKIPVYTSEWVEAVWQTNLSSRYRADSVYFDKYKCPPFYKLNVTSTGLSRKERDDLAQLINSNGGIYSGKFQSELTSVVICKEGTKSEKYHAAKKSKIECCTIQWAFDSVKQGYALRFDKYRIMDKDYASSTLLNQDQTGLGLEPNFSMVSAIHGDIGSCDISESRLTTFSGNVSTCSMKNTPVKKPNKPPVISDKIRTLMNNFADLKEVKKAGPFLDGCCIYLAGFDLEHRDRLCKVLNLGGAIRYDEISVRVTHVIAPDYACSEIERFHKEGYFPITLSLEWIVESFKLKAPAPEDCYVLTEQEKIPDTPVAPNSPLSKKGVQMLRTNSSVSISVNSDGRDNENSQKKLPEQFSSEDDFMKEYFEKRRSDDPDTLEQFLIGKNFTNTKEISKEETLQNEKTEKTITVNLEPAIPPAEDENNSENIPLLPVEDSTGNVSNLNDSSSVFEGLKIKALGWDAETEEQVIELITSAGGKISSGTNRREKIDYIIVPQDFDINNVENVREKETVVTNLWLEECLEENKILPIKYYHKPVFLGENTSILEGCVITLSSYKSFERSFVSWLIEYLGARLEDSLSRKNNRQGVPASTHLICPTPLGSKYTAAKKWEIMIVTHDWLIACAESGTMVPEHLYSVDENLPEKSISVSSKEQIETKPSNSKLDVEPVKNQTKNELVTSTKENKEVPKEQSKDIPVPDRKNDSYDDLMNKFFDKKPSKLPETPIDISESVRSKNEDSTITKEPTNNRNSPIEIIDCDSENSSDSNKDNHDTDQYTPVSRSKNFNEIEKNIASTSKTPLQTKKLFANIESPIGLSQPMTPVAKFFENLGLPKNGTPDNSPLPMTPTHVKTPDTPLGRCFGNPNPSPETRKYWAKRINALPSYHHTPPLKRPRRNSTPLAVLKERLWKKILPKDYDEQGSNADENDSVSEISKENVNTQTPKNPEVVEHVQQLKEMLQMKVDDGEKRKSLLRFEKQNIEMIEAQTPTKKNLIESQNEEIGWDDPVDVKKTLKHSAPIVRRFMFSQMASHERQRYIELTSSLGGIISEITLFDDSATHLICGALTRNEKLLASMAAGKWVLHTSYIEDSVKVGHFLNEELYEYGNPLAVKLKEFQDNPIAPAVCRWRKTVKTTKQRAYHRMKVIILVNSRRDQLIRLIEAGGGEVLNVTNYENTEATHCFVDPKALDEYPQCKILAANGVYCLPPIFLNNILISDPPLNPKDYIIPDLVPYFKQT